MDKKIEELVEWAAEKLYKQRWYEGQPSWEDSQLKQLFRNYAKKILSHPDLALIDRGKKPAEQVFNQQERRWYLAGSLDNCLPVIPLAEAMKEE